MPAGKISRESLIALRTRVRFLIDGGPYQGRKRQMNMIGKYVFCVDKVSDWTGKIACWISVPLVLGTVYDVFMRYVFQAPTKWAYELTWMGIRSAFIVWRANALLHISMSASM